VTWQVSDEFDQYMERASLEGLMALAMLCKEAREVHTSLAPITSTGRCHSVTRLPNVW
jgi:hypothetical protein